MILASIAGALVATNAAGGSQEIALGSFATPAEYHADADSGVKPGVWTRTNLASAQALRDAMSDNLLRSANGASITMGHKTPSSWTWTANNSSDVPDLIDGLLEDTNKYTGFKTNFTFIVTLAEPAAIREVRVFAGWGVNSSWSHPALESVDVRSSANAEWTAIEGSPYFTQDASTWGAMLSLAPESAND